LYHSDIGLGFRQVGSNWVRLGQVGQVGLDQFRSFRIGLGWVRSCQVRLVRVGLVWVEFGWVGQGRSGQARFAGVILSWIGSGRVGLSCLESELLEPSQARKSLSH
jgi:hypothetical protein